MPPLPRKSDASQAPLVPAWHPNFRDLEKLPDTKVVRTLFFVNSVAIALAASLLLYFAYQEYRIISLQHQLTDLTNRITANRKASEQAVLLSKKFADEEKKIGELAEFKKQKIVLSRFLLHLAETLPEDQQLAVDSVAFQEAGISLKGTASGTLDEASERTSAYVERIKQDAYFSEIFEGGISQGNPGRDPASGRLTFDLFLSFKNGGKK